MSSEIVGSVMCIGITVFLASIPIALSVSSQEPGCVQSQYGAGSVMIQVCSPKEDHLSCSGWMHRHPEVRSTEHTLVWEAGKWTEHCHGVWYGKDSETSSSKSGGTPIPPSVCSKDDALLYGLLKEYKGDVWRHGCGKPCLDTSKVLPKPEAPCVLLP